VQSPRKLLVIDHNPDNGALLVRGLARKFPQAIIELCNELGTAVEAAATQQIDAVVLHRTEEDEAVAIIGILKNISPTLPIVVVSGVDRSEQVLRAGAAGFMHYDKWLMIGVIVDNVLKAEAERAPSRALRA
jgi:DNA-binding NtrC family response regulator